MVSVELGELVGAIEQHQPVINKDELPATYLITALASLDRAGEGELSFVASRAYYKALADTKAAAVLVDQNAKDLVPPATMALVVSSPYLAYASVSGLFVKPKEASIHCTAIIGDNVQMGDNVHIGAGAVIGDNVQMGDNVHIGAGAVIGDNVHIGKDSRIDSAVIYAGCQLGQACRVFAHATIGADGFGFAPYGDPHRQWQPIAQLGRVVMGDRVSIGAGTCIDRGALDDTIIGDDVIIDNLVQIAHNVVIGAGTAIAAGTGIAGSTTIGKRCIIGGAVGIVGHIDISDDVTITAMTMVTKSIKTAGSYSSGTTAMPTKAWRRAAVRFRKLSD